MRIPRRPVTLLIATAVALQLSIALSAAAPPRVPLTDAQLTARGNRIADRVMELELSGASRQTVDAVMRREFGLIPLTIATRAKAIVPSSSPDCVTLNAPTAYYDIQAGAHAFTATWAWKNKPGTSTKCWKDDVPAAGGNVGGPDAFGMYVDKAMTYKHSGGNSYTETNVRTQMVNPTDWDTVGVVFRRQDTSGSGSSQYTWDHGNVWMYMNVKSCPVTFTIKSKLAHTWSSSSVTGVNVNTTPPGISVTIANSSYSWQAVNPTAGSYKAC